MPAVITQNTQQERSRATGTFFHKGGAHPTGATATATATATGTIKDEHHLGGNTNIVFSASSTLPLRGEGDSLVR